jgi:hypothetical protein
LVLRFVCNAEEDEWGRTALPKSLESVFQRMALFEAMARRQ